MASNRRAWALAGALLVGTALARCTFDGLDSYSSGDAAPDATTDVTQQDSPADTNADVDAGCSCAPSETCVLGKCETCPATWTLDHPAGVVLNAQTLDPATQVLYVAGMRSVGDAGASTGYLALVDSCTGALIDSFDAPASSGKKIPGLSDPQLLGGKVYLRAGAPTGVPGGYVRFDVATRTFDAVLSTFAKFSSGLDETWQMAAGAGGLWFSGSRAYDQPDAALPMLVHSDGDGGYCSSTVPLQGLQDESAGRAIAMSGNDVYEISTSGRALIHHFDATQCALQPCACAATWTSTPLNITGIFMGAYGAVVVGQKLYVGGAVGLTTDLADMEGFVTYYDLVTSKFVTSPYLYNPTSLEDGFIRLATDGTRLYAAGGKNLVNVDFTTAQGVVVVLDLALAPVATVATPTVKPNAGAQPVPGGFIVSGLGASASAPSRTARCTMQQCP
jgi:hypothetical protein